MKFGITSLSSRNSRVMSLINFCNLEDMPMRRTPELERADAKAGHRMKDCVNQDCHQTPSSQSPVRFTFGSPPDDRVQTPELTPTLSLSI